MHSINPRFTYLLTYLLLRMNFWHQKLGTERHQNAAIIAEIYQKLTFIRSRSTTSAASYTTAFSSPSFSVALWNKLSVNTRSASTVGRFQI